MMNNWSHKTIGNTQMMPVISKNLLQNYSLCIKKSQYIPNAS